MRAPTLQVDAKRLTGRGVKENSIPCTLDLHWLASWPRESERHACRVCATLPVLSSMVVDFTILDVIDRGQLVYTDNLETNGAGAATACGGCAACQSRLVVDHEVGRDIWSPKGSRRQTS
jgi:hypothetical protein